MKTTAMLLFTALVAAPCARAELILFTSIPVGLDAEDRLYLQGLETELVEVLRIECTAVWARPVHYELVGRDRFLADRGARHFLEADLVIMQGRGAVVRVRLVATNPNPTPTPPPSLPIGLDAENASADRELLKRDLRDHFAPRVRQALDPAGQQRVLALCILPVPEEDAPTRALSQALSHDYPDDLERSLPAGFVVHAMEPPENENCQAVSRDIAGLYDHVLSGWLLQPERKLEVWRTRPGGRPDQKVLAPDAPVEEVARAFADLLDP